MHSGERAVREENARRKQQRILQVREQSKEIAAKLRKRIHDERERQKDHVEKLKIDELRKWRDGRVEEQQQRYDHLITATLDANEEAKREVEANIRLQQRKHELDLIAVQRGRTALRKELHDRVGKPVKKLKPRSKSTEVQTDHVSFAKTPTEDEIERPIRIDLPPESFNHDGDEEPIISSRSVDILEKSKRFVEDANRRLNEISAKVARCQAGPINPIHTQAQENRHKELPRSPPPAFQKMTASPLKAVRINNTTRLRCNLQRPPIVDKKTTRPLKKVIPSATEKPPPPPDRQSVTYYDHPNRFTKTYDIPKNIVVKHLEYHEDDAVTNALNETLTNIDEENAKKNRSKELRQKEAIRELEAIEKSQVRRDYEMLAKTLDEVRKTRSNSPITNTGAVHQFVSGNVGMRKSSSTLNMPLASAAMEELLHVPIRISCPKVDAATGQMHLNVGSAAPVDKGDFSSSDSAQTILLDQVANTRSEDEQVVVVTENHVPNVKVRAVKETTREGKEPIKIVIQVESVQQHDRGPPRDIFAMDVARQSRNYRPVDESLSTNYMSPPSEIELQLNRYLKPNPKPLKGGKAKLRQPKNDGNLKAFISKLLQMPPSEVEQLSENDISDVPTPTNSIINMKSNVSEPLYDDKKLTSVSRIIEDNYSILEEVDELIAQNSRANEHSKKSTSGKQETVISTDSIMHRYATMSQNYNDRIHSLSKMIKVIRAEKESLLHDNGLSTVSMSERDTSTKYKDFASIARTVTSSGSELSNDSGEMKQVDPGQPTGVRLGANKIIGLSRDSGISMSRPVTSTEMRENAEEKTFEPMLKDILRQKPLEVSPVVVESDKKRPPNSISRYSPEAIQAAGHDLSTIIEVDTPGTLTVAPQEPVVPEMKKFPTIEEFVSQNGVNVSLLSETDRPESGPVKSFVSFKQFVTANTRGAPAQDRSTNDDLELNLSEIAEELRRRSLLADDSNRDKDNDEKKYLRSLSRELEEMIQRINSHGLKEPHGLSMSSLKSQSSDGGDANESTIGQLIDKIRPNKFPTREEFNLQNNVEHYQSAEILKSFLNTTDNVVQQSEDQAVRGLAKRTDLSPEKASRNKRVSNKVESKFSNGQSSQSSGNGSNKKSSDSVRSQTLNLSDDLMNALENNLSEMGLKWAVNMLKRSHNQISGSSSRGSSSEEKEHMPFESQTMSLLTDLEKSSISDESKTSNIKNIILRELIKNKSGNSSSNGSLSSSNIDRRLLSGTGSDDGRCLRTSTPVNSNVFNSISTSTIVDRDRTAVVDNSECLFSGESKLSSVKGEGSSHRGLNVPDVQLDVGKYARATDSTLSEYSLNEHNKRKLTRRIHK